MKTRLFPPLAAGLVILFLFSLVWGETRAAGRARVDLNQANAVQLVRLPGIGPVLAERIVTFRKKNGPFQRLEELMNVKGIGEKKFLKLREFISLGHGKEKGPAKDVKEKK